MKKIIKSVLLGSMVFLLASCGGKDSESKNGTTTQENEVTKVALLLPGTLGDRSMFDSAHAGMGTIKEIYGDKIEVKTLEMGED